MKPARRMEELFQRSTQFRVGRELSKGQPFNLDFESMLLHALWLGRTGAGKSKGAQLYMRGLMDAYVPFVLVDAEGDLAEDVFADIINRASTTGSEAVLERTHYLKPDWQQVFGCDPFDSNDVPQNEVAARNWVFTQAKRVTGAIIRSQNETNTEGMPRLERVLTNLLIAIGTTIGPAGARLPLANIFILLNFDHPKFDAVYGAVAPNLPAEIRMDFEQLLALRNRPQEILKQTESTINRLRSFLSPVVTAIFSQVRAHTINLRKMIAGRGMIIFNLKDTEYFAPEQADVLGRILIYQIISAVRSVSKGERMPCALIIDECQRFLTRDILVGLAQGRKWGLATSLLTQTLYALELVEAGFGMTVLAAVGTVICLQQRLPPDLEVLTDYLFRPNLCYRELYTVQDRHRGYKWHNVVEDAENWSCTQSWQEAQSRSWSAGFSSSRTSSFGEQESLALAQQQHWSDTDSETNSHSKTRGHGSGMSSSIGTNTGQTPLIQNGQLQLMLPTQSESMSEGRFEQQSNAETEGTATGTSQSRGGGATLVDGRSATRALSSGRSDSGSSSGSNSWNAGGGSSRGRSISYKQVPLAIIEPEWHPTGRLRWSIEDQLDRYKTLIATLPTACAVVRREGQLTEVVQFDFVEEPFATQAFKDVILRMYEKKLHAMHDYFIVPRIDPAAEEQRIDQFLADASHAAPTGGGNGQHIPQIATVAVATVPTSHPF